MDTFIKYAEKKGVNYIEIKNSENKGNIIEAQNGEIKELSSNESKLYAVRLQYKNSIGIAYSNVDNYKELVDKAIKAARALNKNVKLNFESNNEKIKTKAKIKLEDVGLEEKKRNILDYLTCAVKSHIEKSNFPSLLPEISKINNTALAVAA